MSLDCIEISAKSLRCAQCFNAVRHEHVCCTYRTRIRRLFESFEAIAYRIRITHVSRLAGGGFISCAYQVCIMGVIMIRHDTFCYMIQICDTEWYTSMIRIMDFWHDTSMIQYDTVWYIFLWYKVIHVRRIKTYPELLLQGRSYQTENSPYQTIFFVCTYQNLYHAWYVNDTCLIHVWYRFCTDKEDNVYRQRRVSQWWARVDVWV